MAGKSQLIRVCLLLLCLPGSTQAMSFRKLTEQFVRGYGELEIPGIAYDYREYFKAIPSRDHLHRQDSFFRAQDLLFSAINSKNLNHSEQVTYDHICYEITFNLERIRLEKAWVENGRPLRAGGLHGMPATDEWYRYFTRKFVSLDWSPDDIMEYGQSEVNRINREMDSIRQLNGFDDLESFYHFLSDSSFFYFNRSDVIRAFTATDSTIRQNLGRYVGDIEIPPVYPLEWVEAGPGTPPGIYLGQQDNAYGKAVFLYNFFGNRYNKRAIDWIYMHEAIPGHHLQSVYRNRLQHEKSAELFLYPGNFEGWACYVEYFGRELGVYENDFDYFGKCEWDLIRSVRLVLEVGIHVKGWDREEALQYWKTAVHGQDDIADREITRVTNWPGQALSYKLGARFLFDQFSQVKEVVGDSFDPRRFYQAWLSFGMRPLAVIRQHFVARYKTIPAL